MSLFRREPSLCGSVAQLPMSSVSADARLTASALDFSMPAATRPAHRLGPIGAHTGYGATIWVRTAGQCNNNQPSAGSRCARKRGG